MRRIFFTQKMATATISGHKRATTRDHQKALGEWEACTGSWRKPSSVKPFAIIDITSNAENTWQHTIDNFYAEGFDAIEDFRRFMFDTGLQRYAKAEHLYYHEYRVVEAVV